MQRALLKGGGKETTDSFIANDFSVLFRGAEGSEASMTSPAHFHSADAGAWLIAGVALGSHHLTVSSSTQTRGPGVDTCLIVQTLARYRENRSASIALAFGHSISAVRLREN